MEASKCEDSQACANVKAVDPARRQLLLASTAVGAAGVAAVSVPFVSSFSPSERAKAMGAAVEVDVADLRPGEMRVVEWRGKPVWIIHRTPEMLATLGKIQGLADPVSQYSEQPAYAQNVHRSIKPELLVVVGICTHLGCSPISLPGGTNNPSAPSDWMGGFLCPCHGSTFDLAGRVFANKPAPTNLEIPPHQWLTESLLLIGEETIQST